MMTDDQKLAAYTVDQLLDFIESRATHSINFSECDCYVCNMHSHICNYQYMMLEEGI